MQKNDIYYVRPINRVYLGYSCQPKLNGKWQNKWQQLLLLIIVIYVLPITIIVPSSNFNIYSFIYHFNLFHLGWNSDGDGVLVRGEKTYLRKTSQNVAGTMTTKHKEHEWILVLEKSLKYPINYVLFWSRKYPFYFHYIIWSKTSN